MYLLDTNACIKMLNGTSAPLARRFRACSPSQLRMCSVVKSELLHGARNSQKVAANLRLLETFFEPLESLPFDDACAEIAGSVRTELARAGEPIGPNDLLIASIAICHGLSLVTHNIREFGRVPNLRFEDWENSD